MGVTTWDATAVWDQYVISLLVKVRLSNVPCRTSGLPLTNRLSMIFLAVCVCLVLSFWWCFSDASVTVQQINTSVIKQVQQASAWFLIIGLTISVYRA